MLASQMLFAQIPYSGDMKEIDRKVDSLLSVMSIDEKIGQCVLFPSRGMVTGPGTSVPYDDFIMNGQCGNVFGVKTREENERIQKLAIEQGPHSIPLLSGMDVIHGFKTIFPINLAMSCSWDIDLIKEVARMSALEASAAGINWVYSPMCDISRDPRWGRVSEGAGEDPYLGARIADAMVSGYQGSDLASPMSVMACVKHFAAYGAPEGGREYNTVDMSERSLREIYLPPYKAAVQAGAGTVMTSFNEIAGIPSTSNKWLLDDILRKEWGFEGFVVTDYSSISELMNHGICMDRKEAAALSAAAGVNMDMVSNCYLDHLRELVDEGIVSIEEIDMLCGQILRMKHVLGLFDDPFRYCHRSREKPYSDEAMALARKMAAESMVLLKNDGVLPVKTGSDIAVVGDFCTNVREMIGSWTPTADHKVGATLLEGMTRRFSDNKIHYAKGNIGTGFDDAVKAAEESDVIVVTIGIPQARSGEAASLSRLSIPESQKTLLVKMAESGKPVVALLFTGRPLILEDILPLTDALLTVWQPGTTGGDAIADILSGDVNPSGKLTMSFPRNEGQIPVYYNHKRTGRPQDALVSQSGDKYTSKYLDIPNTPLFPFGYGLSYADFRYSEPWVEKKDVKVGESVVVHACVTNTGKVAGCEIAQLYVHDKVASVTRPVKELKGFERIELKPGESKELSFILTPEDLSFYRLNLSFGQEEGEYEVWIGGSSDEGVSCNFRVVDL